MHQGHIEHTATLRGAVQSQVSLLVTGCLRDGRAAPDGSVPSLRGLERFLQANDMPADGIVTLLREMLRSRVCETDPLRAGLRAVLHLIVRNGDRSESSLCAAPRPPLRAEAVSAIAVAAQSVGGFARSALLNVRDDLRVVLTGRLRLLVGALLLQRFARFLRHGIAGRFVSHGPSLNAEPGRLR